MLDGRAIAQTFNQCDINNAPPLIEVQNLNLWCAGQRILIDVSFDLNPREILVFLGASGSGNSVAVQCLSRMYDFTQGVKIAGIVSMDGQEISLDVQLPEHHRCFAHVGHNPNPFVFSIYDNVAYGARIHGICTHRADYDVYVQDCLERAHLWDEVKDVMHSKMGFELSVSQQQRLCIARALSTRPKVLLMDDPMRSMGPMETCNIEGLIAELGQDHAIVLTTDSINQAQRLANRIACFDSGRLLKIEQAATMFITPQTA